MFHNVSTQSQCDVHHDSIFSGVTEGSPVPGFRSTEDVDFIFYEEGVNDL